MTCLDFDFNPRINRLSGGGGVTGSGGDHKSRKVVPSPEIRASSGLASVVGRISCRMEDARNS